MLIKNTTLSKWGNSQGIRISNDILKELDIKNNEVENNQIILTPKKEFPLVGKKIISSGIFM